MFLCKRVHIRQRPYRDVGSSENLEGGDKALHSDFQKGMQWKSICSKVAKTLVNQLMLQRQPNRTELRSMDSHIQISVMKNHPLLPQRMRENLSLTLCGLVDVAT